MNALPSAAEGPALVDLSAVSFMGASGVAVLVQHYQRRVSEGGVLRVVAMAYPAQRFIEVCALLRLLTDEACPLATGS